MTQEIIMQLIDEGFVGWWRKYSAAALFLIAALQSAWAASPEVQALLSPQLMSYVTGALAALGFVGRFIKQTQALP
jgi:hypothetical protein